MCSHYMCIDIDYPHLALSNDLQVHFYLKNPFHNGITRYSYVKACMSIWWFFNHIGCCGVFKLLHNFNNDCLNYFNTNLYCILYYLRLKIVCPWPQSVHKNGISLNSRNMLYCIYVLKLNLYITIIYSQWLHMDYVFYI